MAKKTTKRAVKPGGKPAGKAAGKARVKGPKSASSQRAKADKKAADAAVPQWTPAEVEEAFRRFAKANPAPRTELQSINPFTLLVAVVLSAQATDAGVNKATPALFKLADTPEKMVALGEDRVRDLIKTIGLYRTKAKNVVALSQQLIAQHGGKVPRDRDALEALPGVGRKTANVVLNVAFGEPTIAVDTHIFRVSNRTGLAPGKTPLDVEMKLMEVVPKRYLLHAHHWLILHGRYTCVARRPLCETCLIADLCKWPGKTLDMAASRVTGCARCRPSAPPPSAQRRAIDLVGRGERHLVDEPDEARMLHRPARGRARIASPRLRRARAGLADDEGDRLLPLDVIGDRHHGGLRDVGMPLQHPLDFGRIDVLAAADEHVVGAADEIMKAVGVAAEHVAGDVIAVRA